MHCSVQQGIGMECVYRLNTNLANDWSRVVLPINATTGFQRFEWGIRVKSEVMGFVMMVVVLCTG